MLHHQEICVTKHGRSSTTESRLDQLQRLARGALVGRIMRTIADTEDITESNYSVYASHRSSRAVVSCSVSFLLD